MYNIYLHCGISAKKYYNPLHHKAKNKLSWYQEVLLYFCMLNILVFIWHILSSLCYMSSNDIARAPTPPINKAMLNTSVESQSTHNTSLIRMDKTVLLEYEQLKNTILPLYTSNNVVGFCVGEALEAILTTIKDTKLKSWYQSFYRDEIVNILWLPLNLTQKSAASSIKYIANINIDGISNKFTIGHIFNQFRHMVTLTNHKKTDELNINNNIVCMLCITYEKGVQLYDIIKEMKAKITQNGTINDSDFNNYMQQIRDLKFIMNDMSYPRI